MEYLEPLPEDCPPAEAEAVNEERGVFRIVRENPPAMDDFRSQRAEKPKATFRGVTECQARGLSVFEARQDAEAVLKLPNLKGRRLCLVKLQEGAGKIMQTGSTASHHTWWPLASYDILANCTLVEA